MIKADGYASLEQVISKFPREEVLIKPKAIIECYQEIPCNPCETSCPFNAIVIGEDINSIPQIDFDKCTGCGMCVFSCPGLAIMVAQVKGDNVWYKIPYELLPIPKVGEIWNAVNRKGEVICEARIEGVLRNKSTDRTTVITVSVPKKHLYEFVTVRKPL